MQGLQSFGEDFISARGMVRIRLNILNVTGKGSIAAVLFVCFSDMANAGV